MDVDEADIVIVGAGSAGCVLAGRLSEDPACRVALLEAGPEDHNPWIHVPLATAKLFSNPAVNWMFETEPEQTLGGRVLFQPRGKVLGGSSSINGMNYIRGTPADYDDWRQRGCVGWGWADLLPYFKKAEDQERGASTLHGTGGPLRVSDQPRSWELAERFIAAGIEAGLPHNPDFNGPSQEGVGPYQSTTKNGRRWSTADAYLRPAKSRPNLRVITDAHATRLLFENGIATGVEFTGPNGPSRIKARAQVIVSAGAIKSPQLLQLSGLGPAAILKKCGVEVMRDAPGVGKNLHDHFYNRFTFRCTKPITLNDLANSPIRKAVEGIRYFLSRSGTLSANGLYAGAFARSDPRLERPDLQINLLCWTTKERTKEKVILDPFSGFSMSVIHLNPDARGTVHLKTSDPLAQPAIQFDFLKTDYDVRAMVSGMRLIRKISQQPALKPFVAEELVPGPSISTDAEFEADLRKRGISNFHAVGTCRMGEDPDAVLDTRLCVRGVERLRVVDASIMPSVIGGNTNAPVIAIAEKAADLIRQDLRH